MNLLEKLPVNYKDLTAVAMFAVAVILVIIVAKKLPIVGNKI